MSEYENITLDGEALYLRPWENQRGTKYGPPDRDEYEVTLVNLSEETIAHGVAHGRAPTTASRTSSKYKAGFKEYYKLTSQFKIPLVDSETNPLDDNTFIPNGSKIRVYCEVRPIGKDYQKGNESKFLVTGVQIIEMAEMPDDDWEPATPKAVFEKVQGGFDKTKVSEDKTEGDVPFEEIEDDETPFA